MNEKIMSWSSYSNNGAYQKNTEYGLFSDLLIERPKFSFEYTDFDYSEPVDKYHIDGVAMTEAQKEEVLQAIINRPVPNEFYINIRTSEFRAYLNYTDIYVIRYLETNQAMPDGMAEKRAEARVLINQIESEYA